MGRTLSAKPVQLFQRFDIPLGDDLDRTIGFIAHLPNNGKAFGHHKVYNAIAKPDFLNFTFDC